jgi:hypothetical protein
MDANHELRHAARSTRQGTPGQNIDPETIFLTNIIFEVLILFVAHFFVKLEKL